MMLVEIVAGPADGAGRDAGGAAFAKQIDKLPLPCKSCAGIPREPRALALPARGRC
jgi:hypothetical protein